LKVAAPKERKGWRRVGAVTRPEGEEAEVLEAAVAAPEGEVAAPPAEAEATVAEPIVEPTANETETESN
jgi:hypothetical protein